VTLSANYFERMYRDDNDPWGFTDRWYEERKRAVTLAALPEPRYGRAYEPGCSVGVLTLGLAGRCDSLLASDISPIALREADQRLTGTSNVLLEQRSLPEEWPNGTFDLVVLSEILYYFDDRDLDIVVAKASRAVAPGGTLLAVHWRWDVADYPQRGDYVQRAVASEVAGSLEQTVHHSEADFDLAVYVKRYDVDDRSGLSVAQRTGLQ
jgi:SAM-dependent methyltransferase